jgi:hypothetical protein
MPVQTGSPHYKLALVTTTLPTVSAIKNADTVMDLL